MADLNPLSTGRWLAWLMHDRCLPDSGIPTRRNLTWNTRRVRQQQADHYWSEPGPGMVPCVETHLHRLDITRRIGAPITLWRVSVSVQVFAAGQVADFERHRSYSSEQAARDDFAAHRGQVRACLTGRAGVATELIKEAARG
ncbi:hypothetical protein ACIBCR_15320 [Micromonospora echinospora]|uniref:hypothetical protein n=1 Tax=Micromonospora echinospora TaxID=1877 RepID=UPI0037BC793D